jgi:Kae1-associated kinase Bud32
MGKQKLLAQGAEAIIIKKDDLIIKERIKKSYRIKEIDDKIRKLRTRGEGRLLERAGKIINTPEIIKTDEKKKEITMEFLDGKKLSEHLDSFSLIRQEEILRKIGEDISKIHESDIIHGDLTTSNMIIVNECGEEKIYLIDFGLGFISKKLEDKAVDLHLLKQALEARHFKNWAELFNSFEKGYKKSMESKKVLARLKTVEKRGRYKH